MNLNLNPQARLVRAVPSDRAPDTHHWQSGLRYWSLTTRGAGRNLSVEQQSKHPLRGLADTPGAECLKRKRGSLVTRLDGASLGVPGRLVFKEDVYPARSVARSPITSPRVLKEFENLEFLASHGLPTVEALACAWEGVWPFYRHTYLLTREFENAVSLREWQQGARERSGALTLDEVAGLLAHLMPPLASLHRKGFWISTLLSKNILVRRGPSGPEMALCDTSRLRRRGHSLHRTGAVRDLASLDKWAHGVLNDGQRERALERYVSALGEPGSAAGWLALIEKRRDRLRHETPIGRLSRRSRRFAERVGLGPLWPL
jgi:hypothetical protein